MRLNGHHSRRFRSLVAGRQRVFARVGGVYLHPPGTSPCIEFGLRDVGCL
jgi:hypothetical protein